MAALMPFPLALKISAPAKEDLSDIAQYTFSAYGAQQVDIYLQTLYDAMELLTENPYVAPHRDDVPEGYKVFYASRHVLVFTVDDDAVIIARILHQSRGNINLLPEG